MIVSEYGSNFVSVKSGVPQGTVLEPLMFLIYVTEFAKTDLMGTNTEIHFLPVDESHTHALSRDANNLRLDGQVCFFRWLFSDAIKPLGCIS